MYLMICFTNVTDLSDRLAQRVLCFSVQDSSQEVKNWAFFL